MGIRLQIAISLGLLATFPIPLTAPAQALIRTARSGAWSDRAVWEGAKAPGPGDRVQIRAGHVVRFDAKIEKPIRSIHVAGTLTLDPDLDVLLTVGLIKVEEGDDPSESGFEAHGASGHARHPRDRAAFLAGTPERPIGASHTATIRLAEVEGLDPEECPAIVCLGGRMEFHGAEVAPTWIKLGAPAAANENTVTLAGPVVGWKVGDRVIITATRHQYSKNEERTPKVRDLPYTEERSIRAIDGAILTLDAPLAFAHRGDGDYRGEVALLSRNLVVESARPDGVRGHTMYHRDSFGSISYAEFRHLGKPGKLGKYSLHFHRAGDSMRGSSIIGASIWDSGNRWLTIHGTNRLVVRDCVGYRSLGHGFFLEEGTEVDNVFDHNLAVQATEAPPLPGRLLAFDRNEGAGFWWANSRNAFVRNVAVECDAYGFRFEAPTSSEFDPVLSVRGSDGKSGPVDVRKEPFLRFEANEAHSQRRYGVNLGGGPGRGHEGESASEVVGPDSKHPFDVRGLRVWDAHWGFTPATPGLMVENLAIAHCDFGVWKPNFDRQSYRGVALFQCGKAYYAPIGHPPLETTFPSPLEPVDDRPPVSVITGLLRAGPARLVVRGVSVDDGEVASVKVNGREVRPLVPDYSRWEIEVDPASMLTMRLTAVALDRAGNGEKTPQTVTLPEN